MRTILALALLAATASAGLPPLVGQTVERTRSFTSTTNGVRAQTRLGENEEEGAEAGELLFLGTPPNCATGTDCYEVDFDWPTSDPLLTVPEFDSALGTLDKIVVKVTSITDWTFDFENLSSATPVTWGIGDCPPQDDETRWRLECDIMPLVYAETGPLITTTATTWCSGSVGAYDGTDDFTGPDAETHTENTGRLSDTVTITNRDILDAATDNGDWYVQTYITYLFAWIWNGSGWVQTYHLADFENVLRVEYHYH